MKQYLKYLLYRLHLADGLDDFLFKKALSENHARNQAFLQNNPSVILPDDRILFETYQINYKKFIEDGALAAAEIIGWTTPYLANENPRILDWGCGAGRITRHIATAQPNALLYGCDTNAVFIDWNKTNYAGITFTTINGFSPTPYAPDFFQLAYGFSVLTHIDASMQQEWLTEMHRILDAKGILFITTHGSNYLPQLLPFEKRSLKEKGFYTRRYPVHGRRMMTTYHEAGQFKKIIAPIFVVKEWYDGKQYPEKAGGQDVWILQKK
ncbi:MAG: class I SAM-dependent methyltransferase [Bacteroidota bacterium]